MSRVTSRISISLDGFVAGPDQSREHPLGVGGERLHDWAFPPDGGQRPDVDQQLLDRLTAGVGAYVMGRNMFGPIRGAWDLSWRGWWGEDPPYHTPVYVLTHYERASLQMQGGTTFHFVTDGIASALEQARAAAGGDRDVHVAGGASTIRQALRAGLLDELVLHVAPVLLGAGERLFEDVGDPTLEPVEAIHSPAVTHVRYRVAR